MTSGVFRVWLLKGQRPNSVSKVLSFIFILTYSSQSNDCGKDPQTYREDSSDHVGQRDQQVLRGQRSKLTSAIMESTLELDVHWL